MMPLYRVRLLACLVWGLVGCQGGADVKVHPDADARNAAGGNSGSASGGSSGTATNGGMNSGGSGGSSTMATGGAAAGGVRTGGVSGTGGEMPDAAVAGAVDPSRDGPLPGPDLATPANDGNSPRFDAAPDWPLGRDTPADEAARPDGFLPALDSARIDGGPTALPYLLGADISSTQEQVDQGAHYADTDGTEKSLLEILKDHGFNAIRVRTFVNPTAPYGYATGTGGTCSKTAAYGDKAHVIAMGQLIKAAGMRFLLDFHYSDTWADPGKQIVPQPWRQAASIADMAALLKAYTKDVLAGLVAVGARPDLVQVGNEITPGLCMHIPNSSTDCWGNGVSPSPVSGSTANWSNTATLLTAGIEGVRETDPAIKVMLHIESTDDLATTRTWVTNAISHGVHFDVLGLSCYTAFEGPPSGWQTTFEAMAAEFPTLSFAIAEYNPEPTQANQIIHSLPSGRGVGTFLWEPTQSGAWGSALFTYSAGVYRAQTAAFAEYDTLRSSLGLP
jgi:arabinogalactan endo-1,4-beta-galactosidase